MSKFDVSEKTISISDLRDELNQSLGEEYQVGYWPRRAKYLLATSSNCKYGATYITVRKNGSIKTGKTFRNSWYALYAYIPLLWPMLAAVMISALGSRGRELQRQIDSAIESHLSETTA